MDFALSSESGRHGSVCHALALDPDIYLYSASCTYSHESIDGNQSFSHLSRDGLVNVAVAVAVAVAACS